MGRDKATSQHLAGKERDGEQWAQGWRVVGIWPADPFTPSYCSITLMSLVLLATHTAQVRSGASEFDVGFPLPLSHCGDGVTLMALLTNLM